MFRPVPSHNKVNLCRPEILGPGFHVISTGFHGDHNVAFAPNTAHSFRQHSSPGIRKGRIKKGKEKKNPLLLVLVIQPPPGLFRQPPLGHVLLDTPLPSHTGVSEYIRVVLDVVAARRGPVKVGRLFTAHVDAEFVDGRVEEELIGFFHLVPQRPGGRGLGRRKGQNTGKEGGHEKGADDPHFSHWNS